ncbi:3'-5' exonuclease [Saccharibacillus endophyticus]|uniref:DNA 3'-5' helicase n=1 Tax=Saccharibacillus endophyticus TaxID=2060666 RepID=A0ABQ1ZZH0_9BACL|nr:3'-5' exonuclease [Saccharibacillus endophyticus]GGH81788.1 DNA helicase [Saccharibacillus endophyticus]
MTKLPSPTGKQAEVLAMPEKGHFVVLGTAGSGKTTLAIYRAIYLAKTFCDPGEKVLLVTFNKALVTFLKAISKGLMKNVEVENYHRFARGYLAYRNKMGRKDITPPYSNQYFTKSDLIKIAYELIQTENPGITTLERPIEIFAEEINWIQKHGITTLEEYENVERAGRSSTRISRNTRKYFYMVYDKYLELRINKGYKYDMEDLAFYVREELKVDNTKRRYRHIIIDEGQDFSPVMLQSLASAIPDNGSLTYFGDVAQQIYGSRISWRSAGFNNPRIWKFEDNYRNTKEIATLGLAISKMPYFKDDVDLIEPKFPRASGPLPVLLQFNNEEEEIEYILSQVPNFITTQTAAILVRDRETLQRFRQHLFSRGIAAKELSGDMTTWDSNPGISVGTYHSAKGLEFDIIMMPFCNESRLPAEERILALGSEEEASSEEIKLLYVGVTRARTGLLISYSGNITKLLPSDENLYQELDSNE